MPNYRRRLRRRLRRLSRRVARLEKTGSDTPSFSFDPANFTGTWYGLDIAVNRNGAVETLKTIHLACDAYGTLNGLTYWQSPSGSDVGFDATNEVVSEDAETILGLVNKSTGAMRIVEKAENGTFEGRIGSDGSLSMEQTQPGAQPVVALMHLPKVSDQPNVSSFDSLGSLEETPPAGFV